ncbi:MAG TPA: hypothetical protein VFD32_09020 [Dehalococcoidia bacterium]|nr:hypothetical protein [Dehalococcoidia bacterium]
MRTNAQPRKPATQVVVRLAAHAPAWRTVVSLAGGSTVRVRLAA